MSRTLSQANVNSDTFQTWLTKTNNVAAAFVDVVTVGSNATGDLTSGNAVVNGFFAANTLFAIDGIRGGTVNSNTHLTILSNAVFSGAQVNTAANVYVGASNVHVVSTVTTILSNSSTTAIKVTGNSSATNTYIGGTTLNIGSDTVSVTNSISIGGSLSVANSFAVTSLTLGTGSESLTATNTATTIGTSAQLVDSFDGSVFRSGKYTVSVKDNGIDNFNAMEVLVVHDGSDSYLTEYAKVSTNAPNMLGSFTTNVDTTTVRLYFTPTVSSTSVKLSKTLVEI